MNLERQKNHERRVNRGCPVVVCKMRFIQQMFGAVPTLAFSEHGLARGTERGSTIKTAVLLISCDIRRSGAGEWNCL